MSIRRLRPAGIVPLEIWNVDTHDGWILSDHVGRPSLAKALQGALDELHAGQVPGLEVCRFFDSLFLTGGGVAELGADFPAEPRGWMTMIDAMGPAFAGWRGAQSVYPDALMVNLGQTAMKVAYGKRRLRIPRDVRALPMSADHVEPGSAVRVGASVAEARRELLQFLVRALREGVDGLATPPGIVVALPCALDDLGVPGPSSYLGLEGSAELVAEAVERAGLGAVPVSILNDAELAALSARAMIAEARRGPPDEGRSPLIAGPVGDTLVVTIGFGVGGAFLSAR